MSAPLYPSRRHDRPHARLYDHDLSHPAWAELSGNAFKLISCLLAKHRPNKPNVFAAGGRTVAKLISVDEKTARKAIDELIDKGHLIEERAGRNRGGVKTRERVVSLTRYDTDTSAGNPKLPIDVWRKNNEAEKTQVACRKRSGSRKPETLHKANKGGAKIIPFKKAETRM